MEKYKRDSVRIKWFWSIVYFLCFSTSSYAQFFSDAYIIKGEGANISIQEVLVDAEVTYIYGTFTATTNIEGTLLEHQGESDVFLIKRVDNQIEWIFYGGSAGNDIAAHMSINEAGQVIISGSFWNEFISDELSLKTSGNSISIFALAFSPNGEILESQLVNGTGDKDIIGTQVVDDQIYMAGSFGDTLFIDGAQVVAVAEKDIFLLKFESNTEDAWIQHFGISGKNDAIDFSWSTVAKQFIISGQFDDEINVAIDSIQTNTFDEDVFLAAFNIQGDGKWIRKLGGQFDDFNTAHVSDEEGNIYLTGSYRGIINFDDNTNINTGGIANVDAYLIKCDSSGNRIWARTLGNEGQEFGTDLIIVDGNIYWTGYYDTAFSIDNISFSEPTGITKGHFGIFDLDGNLEANLTAGSNSIIVPIGLAANDTGVLMFGDFNGATNLDRVYDFGSNFSGFAAQINLLSVSTSIPSELETRVFPNPSQGKVTIDFGNQKTGIRIYNLKGQKVYENFEPKEIHLVDLSNLADGVYLWRSLSGKEGKFIKNRASK